MKLKNKFIKIALISVLSIESFTNAYASTIENVVDSSLKNVTPGSSYNINGKKIYTSTSVYFRFGPTSANFQPIYHISPPDISVSCSGFNLKGMFVSMLGLDRISKMLKSAGASFAWGVVVGLIYSLPGIFSAFKMLNAWAKKIQQLLQNACNSGRNLAKNLFGKKLAQGPNFIDNTLSSFFSGVGSEGAINSLDSIGQSLKGTYFNPDWFTPNFDKSNDLPNIDNDKIKELYGNGFETITAINSAGTAWIHMLLDDGLKRGQDSEVKNIFNSGGNPIQTSITGASGTQRVANINYLNISASNVMNYISKMYSNADDKTLAYIDFIYAVLLRNNLNQQLLDNDKLEQYISAANAAMKNKSNGTTPSNAELKKINLLDKKDSLGEVRVNNINNTSNKFGKLIGRSFGKTLTQDSVDNNFKMPGYKGLSFTILGINENKNEHSKVAVAVVESVGKNNDLNVSGFVSATDKNDSVETQAENYVEKLLNGVTPDSASTSGNYTVPKLLYIGSDKIHIYKQSGEADKFLLKSKLKDNFMCFYTVGILDLFDKVSNKGGSINNFYSTDGNSVTYSRMRNAHTAKSHSVSLSKSDIYKDFRSGLIEGLLSDTTVWKSNGEKPKDVEGYCRKQMLELDSLFKKIDKINRENANQIMKESNQGM